MVITNKHKKEKVKKQGFPLVEVLITLVITSGMFLVVVNTFINPIRLFNGTEAQANARSWPSL